MQKKIRVNKKLGNQIVDIEPTQLITSVKIKRLDWLSDRMKTVTIKTPPFDKTQLRIDDCYSPNVGELCLVETKFDIVRKIRWQEARGAFKGYFNCLVGTKWYSQSLLLRVDVLTEYNHKGNILYHTEPSFTTELENEIRQITEVERQESMPLINKAYKDGYAAFATMRDYYSRLREVPKPARPTIVNPYEKLDIENYNRFEMISNFNAGYKKADDEFISSVFSKR